MNGGRSMFPRQQNRHLGALFLGAGLALALLVAPTASAVPVSARVYVTVASEETSTPQVHSDGEFVTNSTALANSRGFGSALARGEPGVGGVSALISSNSRSTAAATLRWEDTWTISPIDVDLIGQYGRVVPVFMLSGSGTAQSVPNATATAVWSMIGSVGPSNTRIAGGTWHDVEGAGVVYTGDPIGEEIVGSGIELKFNEVTDIRFLLNADAWTECFASCAGNRSASVDLSNTLAWQGLVVTDQFGEPIEFTMAAASGVDYTQPVPEPITVAMQAVALLVLALLSKLS